MGLTAAANPTTTRRPKNSRPERSEGQKVDEQIADESPCEALLEADDQREEDGNHENDLGLCVGDVDPRGDRPLP